MKTFALATTLVFALASGQAMAICTATGDWKKMDTAGSGGSLALNTLTGKTVCVGAAPTWQAQEYHQTGGALIDYKRGPAAPGNVDPSEQVGAWSILGNQMSYSYTNGGNYTFDVYENSGAYSFCTGAASVAEATLRTGQVPC